MTFTSWRPPCRAPSKSHAPPAPVPAFPSNAVRFAATLRSMTCSRSATCRRSTRWCRSARRRASSRGFPTNLLHCRNCDLVQLGLAVDPAIIFPPEYPYTSGTTKLLRDNFADLQRESAAMLGLGKDDLVVDIGSNDGTLLSNFKNGGHRVLGIEPTDVGDIANQRGIPTIKRYFGPAVAREVRARARARQRRHRRKLLCPHRGRARDRRRHRRDAQARRRVHFRIALSRRAFSTRCNTIPSIMSICAIIRWRASSICWKCTISKCSTRGRFRATAARSASMRRGAAACTVQDSVQRMLAGEPRGEAMAKRLGDFRARCRAFEIASAGDDARS